MRYDLSLELDIQWNFPITDNLGAGILSFIVRLSIFGS